ncbi:MAG TPA: hypothetical protein VK760_09900 [Candidatus Acidoferrales bacterium]|nr:hypothetical protein [Candidatus Acidoferrales bacterium]
MASLAILLALLPALTPSIAQAAPALSSPAGYNFGAAAFRAIFGETTDASASLAATYGDLASESPMREFAIASAAPKKVADVAFAPGLSSPLGFAQERARRSPSAASSVDEFSGRVFAPSGTRFVPVAFYEPVPSISVEAPQRLDVAAPAAPAALPSDPAPSLASTAVAPISFGKSAYSQKPANALTSGLVPTSVAVPVSMQLGRLRFDGQVNGAETQTSAQADKDSGYDAGANFDVRAGGHRVNVDVSSSYEHLMRDDTISYSSALPVSSKWEIGGDAAPALPSYADMSKLALGANVAVPVTTTMTLGLNYNAQRLLGEYGLPGIGNLDAIDNSLGGRVTLAIPKWSSQISLSASQYHYQDNIAPANTFSDLRGNVNFTVKF